MKRQIRYGCFESNSSSSHTVCFTNKDAARFRSLEVEHEREYPSTDTLVMCFGEFGWGPDTFIDEISKLCYALTMVAETEEYGSIEEFYETEGFKNINELVKTNSPYIDGIKIPEDEFDFKSKWRRLTNGYIDHQSSTDDYHSLQDFLDNIGTTLYDFIFNPDVILVIDNDNH